MSWLYSRALVEEYWGDGSLDGEPFAQWNPTSTPPPSWSPAKMMARWNRFQSGTTWRHLTDGPGEELLMSFQEDFRVRTFQLLGKERESQGQNQDCGNTWPGSLERLPQDRFGLRTVPISNIRDWRSFWMTFGDWGMMQNGELSPLKTPALPTRDGGNGLLGTPLATDSKGGGWDAQSGRLRDQLKSQYGMGCPHPTHSEMLMGWPVGWTALEPLETDRFQQWLDSHGAF
jgi:hypothetical protein